MAYVLKKRDRYMTGHSYSTAYGYSFSWSDDPGEARRFADDDPSGDHFAARTGAKIIKVGNSKQELRALGKRAATCSTQTQPARSER